MRIQHNIMAMSAYRNYTNNVSAMKKNLEKLSSGYKINRAGDDAAGLAISEKMRAQITGLETAQKNAKDGISLVQTAEGALTEVHDMLNRMVELATQSANGTYSDDVDREQLQKEIKQLTTEIDRISKASNFNGINLLDGSLSQSTTPAQSVAGEATGVSVTPVADGDHDGTPGTPGVYSFDIKDLEVSNGATNVATISAFTIGNQALVSGGSVTIAVTNGVAKAADIAKKITVTQVAIGGITYNVATAGTKVTLTATKAPTTNTEILTHTAANAKVNLTVGAKDGINNSWDQAVHADTPASIFTPSKVAQGSFTLTDDMVKDGQSLRIGDTTYTFAVGKDSEFKGVANVIDLTKYEEGSEATKQAMLLLSQQKDNKLFDITTDGTTMYLTEKMEAGKGVVDYDKQWNLKGPNATGTADGAWNSKVGSNSDTKTGVVSWQKKGTVTAAETVGKGLTLQIGDTAKDYNQITVSIDKCDSASIGVGDIDISTQTGAQMAVDKIKDAINYVSNVRGTLGATQNRLEHTINNLGVMTENIQDAESTIRDVDVAEEMMAYTKNNILIQSAQAMLAQANQVPQGVLQLLQ